MAIRPSQLWQHLMVRIILAWLVIGVLPALIMWLPYLHQGYLLTTQKYSLLLVSFGVLLAQLLLDKLTHFPGQRSLIHVLPTLLIVSLLIGLILLIFRLPYSVYYLAVTFVIGTVFLFISQIIQHRGHKTVMAYIPVGRCQNLPITKDIEWLPLALATTPVVLSMPPHATVYQTITDKKRVIRYDEHLNVDAIVADLSSPQLDKNWQRFLAQQTLNGVPVYNHLQVHESLTGRSPIQHLYENDLGSLLPSQLYLTLKQWLDGAMIILTAPIVMPIVLLTIIAIRLESSGNAIFTQERVGQGGKIFRIYKLRSMAKNAEASGARLAQTNDARVTKVGRFIRKTRIDELPQFINVLKGEMSLIGPRPEQKSFVDEFEQKIPFYGYRHIVKPGISGWAQVTQGYASDEDETKVKLEHDFYYIKNFSFTLDMLIVIKTIQTMITGFGAK